MSDDNKQQDPFAMFRQFWKPMEQHMGGFMPPLSEEELSRKINELKTVEGWLSLQLSMLQMTIKTMEMQQTALSTLKRSTDQGDHKP
ncbi:hypothetical protein KSF73_05310 [Burkholderiaceae bacterium DAT-1]|nr:hypothetical protein [Burkholderiaceae bacterium DAT-1]